MIVADVPVGTQIGKYRITGRLGKGGMGIVYAGEDTRLRRPVAIKLLAESVAHEAEVLKRFLLEARAAARLNHPNVVTIHDVGQRGNAFYIVMELVSGGSVQARLDAQGSLPWPEATRIIADICRGLGAAHAAGLIHRDVKPANILLASDGAAKLADFGLTKAPALTPGGLTQVGTVIGTPQYMSPEHCVGEPLDARTDLYSLGATYYTLLVGEPPYDGLDVAMILYAHRSAPVPDPRQALPALPASCARIIARAMAKTRSDRFNSADDMLRDLLALSPAGATPAQSVVRLATPSMPSIPVAVRVLEPVAQPVLGHTPHWKGRRFVAFALGGLSVLLVGTWLLLGGVFFGTHPTPSPQKGQPEVEIPAGANVPIVLRHRRVPLVGHEGEVKAVSIAGGHLASAGADSTVRVWALDTGALLQTMQHPVALEAVALSPDGKQVAAGGLSKTVGLWDTLQGNELGTLTVGPSNITSLAFSPSGKQLAIATETELHLCDFEPPARFSRRVRLLHQQYVMSSVAFSQGGKKLAACNGDGFLHVWDLPSLTRMTAPGNYSGRLTAVAVSDDGGRIALGNHQGVVHLWEPERGTPPTVWNDKAMRITSLAFVPRRDMLVLAGEWGGPLRLCDLAARTTTRIPTGVAGVVNGLCFTDDGAGGRTLAAACSDGTVRLWDVMPAAGPK